MSAFSKPALPLSQQLQKWQSRGLQAADPAREHHYLRFIGYCRLSACTLPFQQLSLPGKGFLAGAKPLIQEEPANTTGRN